MKRFVLVALSATALALAAALPVGADTVGDASPACADITEGHAAFNFPAQGNATATGSLFTNAASCTNVTYTMWVSFATREGETMLKVATLAGDGSAFFDDGTDFVGIFTVRVPKNVESICIGFTTSQGSTILDKAPDAFSPPSTGCVSLAQNESGGGFFW